jgi:hypothetical protein
MKKLLLTAALVAGSLTFAGNMTPSFAQGGAGGDVSTPRKSVSRVGIDKRDDSMNAGRPAAMKHARHKRHKKKMKRMTQPGTTQGGSSSTPSMAPTGTSK